MLSTAGGGEFVTAFAGSDYVSFMLALLVIFGVSFELPLLVVMLNRIGVLPYRKLKKWQRGIILGLFVFAAIVTSAQDPISMCALAGTLTLLFAVAVQVARIHDRRKAARQAVQGWENLPEDQASSMDHPSVVAGRYDDVT